MENNEYFNQDSELTIESNISTELILRCNNFEEIIQLSSAIRITELNMAGSVFIEILVKLINDLPNLDTLRIIVFVLA